MKKVLAIVLILAAAQIASAAYWYWDVQAVDVDQGEFVFAFTYSGNVFDEDDHLGVWAQEFNYTQFDHFGLGNPNGGNQGVRSLF